ncbi:ADR197Wp [Eremothecium gossypii ATCC 10895]|uniref:ADR197Wp n=1 Tax=Eremothecium gossypii (strain ATCC 10895 / CBS 109.51 / FGSC 9923 / NRRL Y-1056) TaxID=284811 RepID=Q759S6_EREGS|nr:ADR197Wp [Eremothecium gossypii ATCC 10895]AAS52117.2 ADR197Wp [Eremothecium gossypii ATCC 10895]AEY96416.1 FADR197Wp [Eremothecium gossypii FDAG1]
MSDNNDAGAVGRHLTHPGTRDLPTSLRSLCVNWYKHSRAEIAIGRRANDSHAHEVSPLPGYRSESFESSPEAEEAEAARRTLLKQKRWAIFTTGAGLFSDGYINNSIGVVNTCLDRIYGDKYRESPSMSNVASLAFAGTVLGQLSFGYFADRYGRKLAMLVGTGMLILFTILAAGAWGKGTSQTEPGGLFAALAAYRFLVGIAIGSEYSTGSPAAAEASNALPRGRRNRWFVWFTNTMIDLGFVVATIVPVILLVAGIKNLTIVWRLTLGLGALPPLSLFYLRTQFKESEEFAKTRFRKKVPYVLVAKFYWFRVAVVSTVWFLYNFSSYAFGTYSSYLLNQILGDDESPTRVFAWNILFTFFYLPGSLLGALLADYIGPRLTLAAGVFIQGIVGFAMAGCLDKLKRNVAGFTVIYGIFMSLGEMGPGDNIGLLASKTTATPVRGQLYGLCAAIGKIGAFTGTYAFPHIIAAAGGEKTTSGLQAPFYLASSLAIISGIITLLFLPCLGQDVINEEDQRLLEYLSNSGYDVNGMGEEDEKGEVITETMPRYSGLPDKGKLG